ncbi:uncharacterized protein LOC124259844 isoform X3 [Haliotis rubra]|uniref:uncharacterized protein LOC124259844 isoform X3 n=1 Tax=Haliotis rubra TaxID=36100 RepID=UPI001EE57D14|nr:uncharacterized protein LOC124259844 isoform X3 [Haliotis rubra]
MFRMALLPGICLLVLVIVVPGESQNVVTLPGDVLIGGLFSIQTSEDGQCTGINRVSVQVHEAVRWTLQQLNRQNFIPGVKLGLMASKTCGDPARAVKRTLEMFRTSEENTTALLFGVLGPESTSETQPVSRLLSSLPVEDRLLQISYSATAASLTDKTVYKNLYRVIAADNVQVEVMLQLIQQLKWNYVAIGYENESYSIEGATALKEESERREICIPLFEMITTTISIASLREKLDIKSSPVSGMVFFGRGRTVTRVLEYFDEHLYMEQFQLIVSEAVALEPSYLQNGQNDVFDRAKGLLVPTPVYEPISEFTSYWNFLFENATTFREEAQTNRWLSLYFQSLTGCDLLPGTDITKCWSDSSKSYKITQQPLFISYAVLATGVVAQALKNVISRTCGAGNTLCNAMRDVSQETLIAEIEKLRLEPSDLMTSLFPWTGNISFIKGEIHLQAEKSLYEVYNYKRNDTEFNFHKVGSYNGSLHLSFDQIQSSDKSGNTGGPVPGNCQKGHICSECVKEPSEEIIHIKGDHYVVALVPIHNKQTGSGDSQNVFKCGPLRPATGVDIAEALVFAVKDVNSETGEFASVTGNTSIGLVVLDTCNNPLIIRDKIVKLHRGELHLGGRVFSSAITDKVIGYIGPLASSISIPLASTMEQLDQLFIAYASTSSKLKDRKTYPTFMRTASSLDDQVQPMMKVAKKVGASYIQVLYTDEAYGQSGRDSVLEGAKKAGVCVAQSVPVEEDIDPKEYVGIVYKLRQFRAAKMVIVFSRSHTTPALMKALSEEIELGEFIFFGSGEGWARRTNVIKGNYNLKGSFTMAQDLPVDPNFEQYFRNISSSSDENPWLRPFLEKSANCYFPDSFLKKDRQECTASLLSSHHQIDTWVPFATTALYALVRGFRSSLLNVCWGAATKCREYSTTELIRYTKDVELDVFRDGKQHRVFDEDGNGASGFVIYQIVGAIGSNDLEYKEVGRATGDSLAFNMEGLEPKVTYSAECPSQYECDRCVYEEQETTDSPIRDDFIAAVAVEAAIILLLTVTVIIMCMKYRKLETSEEIVEYITSDYHKDHEYAYAEPVSNNNQPVIYLHPVDDPNRQDDTR